MLALTPLAESSRYITSQQATTYIREERLEIAFLYAQSPHGTAKDKGSSRLILLQSPDVVLCAPPRF